MSYQENFEISTIKENTWVWCSSSTGIGCSDRQRASKEQLDFFLALPELSIFTTV